LQPPRAGHPGYELGFIGRPCPFCPPWVAFPGPPKLSAPTPSPNPASPRTPSSGRHANAPARASNPAAGGGQQRRSHAVVARCARRPVARPPLAAGLMYYASPLQQRAHASQRPPQRALCCRACALCKGGHPPALAAHHGSNPLQQPCLWTTPLLACKWHQTLNPKP
jgi:hypothetical protein